MSLTLTKEVLSKYQTSMFVETGSYQGGGIALAQQCGFKWILSSEIDKELCQQCQDRFRDSRNVAIHWGSSVDWFKKMLRFWTCTKTYWLDAHFFDGKYSPLMKEVDLICEHEKYQCYILIDDMRVMKSQWQIDPETIINKFKKTGRLKNVGYENNMLATNDILVITLSGLADGC